MTEIELHHEPAIVTPLSEVMDYARAVSTANMLPENYRGKPADIMLAVGLGQSMGLSPAESLYRISVIKGKPTASAELIAANVRKAGHRLRVIGDDTTCTATIIRADDPEFAFEVTRDLEWARRMSLADQPNYRKQPGTMLQWRAISAVARLACPEALYGVSYTPDEMGDMPPSKSSRGGLAAALSEPEVVSTAPLDVHGDLAKQMYDTIADAGITDVEVLPFISGVIGRDIASSKEMAEVEATLVLEHLADVLEPAGDAS